MNYKKVKIVATLGPSSNSPEMIEKLALAGVDVFRLNLSHQDKGDILRIVNDIREIEKKTGRPLTIMGDLTGLKIRIGNVTEDIFLKNDQVIHISEKPVLGTKDLISINHPSILKQLKKDSEIYIDDGLIRLVVDKELTDGIVSARVLTGGPLQPYKGFYAHGISLYTETISDKDKEDIDMMIQAKADALAVSFVQSEKDILQVRERIPADTKIVLIAKIETQPAIENIDKIVEVSDGVMVARGDLGLAVPMAEVPVLQKKLIALCLQKAKPVITATQMLESMIQSPTPTRAEVADVANAILDGTDAVMLSEETAVGKFPLQTVEMMAKVIQSTAPYIIIREFRDENEIPNAVSASAGMIANMVGAKLIMAFTISGITAQRIARYRYPQDVIVALSPSLPALRKLNFCWGVYPKFIEQAVTIDASLEQAKKLVESQEFTHLEKGEPYVVVTGVPFGQTGSTNLIYVEKA